MKPRNLHVPNMPKNRVHKDKEEQIDYSHDYWDDYEEDTEYIPDWDQADYHDVGEDEDVQDSE